MTLTGWVRSRLTGDVLVGATVAAPAAAAANVLLSQPLSLPRAVLVAGIAGAGMVGGAVLLRFTASRLVAVLFSAAVLLVDFAPLSVYRYLLLSDVLLLGAFVLHQWSVGSRIRVPWLLEAVFIAFLTSHLVALLRSPAPETGAFTWLHMAFLMLVYVPAVTTLLASRPDLLDRTFVLVMVSGVAQAAFINLVVWRGLSWTAGTRIAGVMGNAALWVFAATAVGLVALVLRPSWRERLIGGVGALVLVPTLVFLRSRSLWVAVLLGAVVLIVIQAGRWWRGAAAAAALSVALGAAFLGGLLPEAVERRISATLQGRRSEDVFYRFDVVRRLLPRFNDSPLVGIGMGQSPAHLPEYFTAGHIASIHNVTLHAAVEGGLVAGAAVSFLPVCTLIMWLRVRRVAVDRERQWVINWAFATLIGIFAAVQFTPSLYEHVAFMLMAVVASQQLRPVDHHY